MTVQEEIDELKVKKKEAHDPEVKEIFQQMIDERERKQEPIILKIE